MRTTTLALILAGLSTSVAAQEPGFVLEDEIQVCSSCHGDNGVPLETEYPAIWGQEYFYIFTQLRDYGAGRRNNEIMTGMAEPYSRDEAKLIAQHFAEQRWPDLPPAAAQEGDGALAQAAITGGQCSACHGKWQGDSRIPRLAGQSAAYLEQTMKDFKNEVRLNAPDKISTMKQLSDEQIEAMARYLSALTVRDGQS